MFPCYGYTTSMDGNFFIPTGMPMLPVVNKSSMLFNVGERYEMKTYLGSGTYGHVKAALDKLTGKMVAIKKLKRIEDIVDAKRVLREIRILRTFRHTNILNLKKVILTETNDDDFGEIYLVTNLMDIDLHKIKEKLTDDHIQYIVYQILRGLLYLHSANVIHRDLKPRNILATSSVEIQICDFGFARNIDFSAEDQTHLTEYVVTKFYRAPEIMMAREYSKAVDMWSVGCIMAELMTGQVLFKADNYGKLITLMIDTLGKPKDTNFITNRSAQRYLDRLPDKPRTPLASRVKYDNKDAMDLLEKMLEIDPSKRITVEEALAHPYLKFYHDSDDEPVFEGAIDFKFENDPNISLDDLKALIKEEIAYFSRA